MDNAAQRDGELDLAALAARLWRGRKLLAAIVGLFTVAFAAVAWLMTPIYRASTVLVPASHERVNPVGGSLSLSGLASIAGINLGAAGDAQTQEALAVLRSREFCEGFIQDLQLLPQLYADKWDAKARDWSVPVKRRPTLARACKGFHELVTIVEDKKTGLIRIDVEWRDPREAARWSNEMVARLNSVMRERAIRRTGSYLGYLQRELEVTPAVETRQAIGRLMESQINERMLANVTDEYALRVVDKALPPDPQDPARPKRALLLVLGVLTGLFVGSVAVLLRAAIRGTE